MIADRALLRAADYAFKARNRQALANAGAFIDSFVLAREEGNLLDHFANVRGNFNGRAATVPRHPGFLRRDGDAFFDRRGIMRANFRADAVLQRRDNLSARGVILRGWP